MKNKIIMFWAIVILTIISIVIIKVKPIPLGLDLVGGSRIVLEAQTTETISTITQDMMDLTHWLTRVKIMPDLANDLTVPETERVRGKKMAETLSMASLTSVWQMLLKGILEVKGADNALKTLEMLVVRLAYAADLPSPAQMIEDIKKNSSVIDVRPAPAVLAGQSVPVVQSSQPASSPQMPSPMGFQETAPVVQPATPTVSIKSIADMAKLAREKREMLLAFNIENHVRPIEITDGKLVCSFTDSAPDKLSFDLTKFLTANTGINWTIETKLEGGAKTQSEVKEEKKNQQLAELKQHPVVGAVLNAFKGAKIEKLTPIKKMDFADEAEDTTEVYE